MKRFDYILLVLIIALGLFLRIWNYHELFYFAIDEEKAAYIIRGIVTGEHFPSIGHPSSIGFRLGPLQYYILAPFYALFGLSPISWGYVGIIVSLFSMILIFLIGSKINRRTGFIAVFLYAISYVNTLYDRRGWQETFHSLIALCILYSLLKIKKGAENYLFLLTVALICASHFEVATILFIPLVFIIWSMFRLKVSTKKIVVCIGLFVLFQLPLLFFDIRHQFINTKYLLNYFQPHANERIAPNKSLTGERRAYLAHNLIPYTFTRLLVPSQTTDVAIQYANCPQYLWTKQQRTPVAFVIATGFLVGLYVYMTLRNRNNPSEANAIHTIISVYLCIITLLTVVYTYIFHGEMAEYYLQSVFAYFFILIAYLMTRFITYRHSWGIFIILFGIAFMNIGNMMKSYSSYGYADKVKAVQFSINAVKGQPFVLDSFQTCWYSGGYRYLYTYFGSEPVISYMDEYMDEYYTTQPDVPPIYRVALLTPELLGDNPIGYEIFRDLAKQQATDHAKFGEIEVYIQKL